MTATTGEVLALQAAYDAIDAMTARADESQLIVAAKCRALCVGYDARWHAAGYVPLGIERTLQSDLVNPDTKKISRTFTVAGKLDVIATMNARRFLFDHKTCSQDISPEAPYWRQLAVEGQVNHYYLLAWLNGEKFDGAIWDVVRKPSISPKKITKAERASVVSTQSYCGTPMSAGTLAVMQTEERETLEMYEARLVHDCTIERPEWYFARRAVPRMDHEIMEYAQELWAHGQDVLATRNATSNERLPPRNSGACMLYGSPCKFLGICSGHDSPTSDKWQPKQSVHNELDLPGDGRGVLTNSRIRCFQTCRRKHYYEYELGIERYDEEEKESLFFGSVFHAGLNAWWSTFLETKQ